MWGPQDMTAPERVPTLAELTRDWFYFLSTYRRQVKAMPAETAWARQKLESMLQDMERASREVPVLRDQYNEVKHALVYFADEILLNCRWDGEAAWARDLLETSVFNTRHGGQDFFARLEGALARSSPDVLGVYYRCLALGFQGKMLGQDLELAELRRNVYKRLDVDEVRDHRICPEAYEPLDDREFQKLPGVGTARVLIASVAIVAAVLVAARMVAKHPWNGFVEAAEAYLDEDPAAGGGE